MVLNELKELLESKFDRYNRPEFIESDPVQVPHLFSEIGDIEISGFLTACLAWGQRKTIIRKSIELIKLMDSRPHEFIMHAKGSDFHGIDHFCHRTFQGVDARFFVLSLRNLYENHGGLRQVFTDGFNKQADAGKALEHFRRLFFELPHPARTGKHVSDVSKGASAKRLNMFLRWMVRKDNRGVDFGLWPEISPGLLMIPLDLHTGNTSRKLGLLDRKTNDWRAVCQLTQQLQRFDPSDPVKYDFALFGMGVFDNF
jgi:uncharacterized protein (TIGR02757 family)